MKILVVGGGGREHAICWALSKSNNVSRIYAAPGNGGIEDIAQCVPINPMNFEELIAFAKNVGVDLTICPMDAPLVAGIVDAFQGEGLTIFGPNKHAAQIEGSKSFAKDFMKKYSIPTASYEVFEDYEAAMLHVVNSEFPLVIKADGLAAGKGVLICANIESAERALDSILNKRIFGASGKTVVIEEFLHGVECSMLCFCDGENILPMTSAKDHKAAFDRDYGPNTGGMGVISPNPHYTRAVSLRATEEIFKPTMEGFKQEGIDFVGVLFVGLMLTEDGPKVIEYNCRPGDPETQAVLMRLDTDFLDCMLACVHKKLDNFKLRWKNSATCCVVAASKGYPGEPKTGFEIYGLRDFGKDVKIFHAGTKKDKDTFFTNGGRVFNVVASGKDLEEARETAYKTMNSIDFLGMHYRKDIGDLTDMDTFAQNILAIINKKRGDNIVVDM
ncbi:MAG: phosphoribosylamine--glycine ligase [Defluviitaleaceae bacterium]|nr:phosphoribosylamine--glycine ligase [Defluviitaleaceae bacterium]